VFASVPSDVDAKIVAADPGSLGRVSISWESDKLLATMELKLEGFDPSQQNEIRAIVTADPLEDDLLKDLPVLVRTDSGIAHLEVKATGSSPSGLVEESHMIKLSYL
jgi:hypothetical protein